MSSIEGIVGVQTSRMLPQEKVSREHAHAHENKNTGECAICMEALNSNKNFAKTNCGHSFCLTCLVSSLKSNNTCPLCRANIEEERPKKIETLTLDTCVELIKEEIDMFPYEEHLASITMFDNPRSSLTHMLRVFSIGLSKSIIAQQTNEDEWESAEEEEDEEEE